MAKYVVLENVAATKVGSKIVTLRVVDSNGTNEVDAENGIFVALGDLVEGQREVHKATEVKLGTATGTGICLVASPEDLYDDKLTEYDFINKAGTNARGYLLSAGDHFKIYHSEDSTALNKTVNVGNIILKVIEKNGDTVSYEVVSVGKAAA